jgi:hypothetical protein
LSEDYTNDSPAMPGGLSKSKPAWPNTPGVFSHAGFFVFADRCDSPAEKQIEGNFE